MGQRKVNGWRMRWEVSNVPWVQLCVQPHRMGHQQVGHNGCLLMYHVAGSMLRGEREGLKKKKERRKWLGRFLEGLILKRDAGRKKCRLKKEERMKGVCVYECVYECMCMWCVVCVGCVCVLVCVCMSVCVYECVCV